MNEIADQFLTAFLDPANLVGHIAYLLLIVSMMMRNITWLRILAISAGTVSAIYYASLGDIVSMFWEVLFTLVNVIQLIIIAWENRPGEFSEEEQMFITTCIPDLERAHVRRLVKLGEWMERDDDETLIVEDTCPEYLKFLVGGAARVEREGKMIGAVGAGDFLGEMSYLTGKTATATVITETPVRFMAFERETLRNHLDRHPAVRHALEASFNRNLVKKLVKSNQMMR